MVADKILTINRIWKEYKTQGEKVYIFVQPTAGVFKGSLCIICVVILKRQQAQKKSLVLSPPDQTETK